jgi:hypothetical protein
MHGLEVVAEQIAQTKLLLRGDILFALQNAPARFLQQRRVALLGHLAGLGNADCIGSRLRWPPLVTKRYTKGGAGDALLHFSRNFPRHRTSGHSAR